MTISRNRGYKSRPSPNNDMKSSMEAASQRSENRYFVQTTIALLVVAFITLLGIVGMTIWLGERAQIYFDEVIEARDLRAAAVDLRNAIETAESSQRGFLFTGNEIYLAPYNNAKSLALKKLVAVQQSLGPRKEYGAALNRLTAIVNEKLNEMDQTIALKRDRRDVDALNVVRTNRGKALMDEANVFFSGIIRSADATLTAGVDEQRTNAVWLRLASIAGGIVIVCVVGAVIFAFARYIRELAQKRNEISALNENLEIRVEQRTADLSQANSEIQRFAYIVTHDLRAPLVNIMGFTSELEGSVSSLQALIDKSNADKDLTDPIVKSARIAATVDLPEAIGFIRSSTKKMDQLIGAILKLSREGRRTLRPEDIDLGEVVKTSATAIQHQLSEANGEINVDPSYPSLFTDKLSLEQTLGNLFDNAVKYRSKLRPLRIGIRAQVISESHVSIEVTDNGRGIAAADQERVFDLFRRSGGQDQKGEGIGLAHVRTLVRNLGGEITLTSALDKGTTIHCTLLRNLQIPGSES